MKEIACRLEAYIQAHPLIPVTAIAKLYWISYIKPMPNPMRAIPPRSVTDSTSWRNFYTPCPWRITMQYSISVATFAVLMSAKHLLTACSTELIL